MTDEAFTDAWEAGGIMPGEEVVSFALGTSHAS
jgi:hypothetical protein